jgi:hypothetical protein
MNAFKFPGGHVCCFRSTRCWNAEMLHMYMASWPRVGMCVVTCRPDVEMRKCPHFSMNKASLTAVEKTSVTCTDWQFDVENDYPETHLLRGITRPWQIIWSLLIRWTKTSRCQNNFDFANAIFFIIIIRDQFSKKWVMPKSGYCIFRLERFLVMPFSCSAKKQGYCIFSYVIFSHPFWRIKL